MIKGINHVTIVVTDKKSAEDFYCLVLGCEKKVVGSSLWVKVGGQFIHINENKTLTVQKNFKHFAIEVSGLQLYLGELVRKGVTIFDFGENEEQILINSGFDLEKRNFFVYDPFGNLIEFIDSENTFFKAE